MNTFFINTALNVKRLSVYDNDTRFSQLMGTLDSINRYVLGNRKYIFDSSPEEPDLEKVRILEAAGVNFMYFGADPVVKAYSDAGFRSLAETTSFKMFLKQVKYRIEPGRIYKLSGRYQLNENCSMAFQGSDLTDSFVFSKALDSWMHPHAQARAGVSKLFRLRFWHMDTSLLEFFISKLDFIYQECLDHHIDIEHAYYKVLSPFDNIKEVDKIGVEGYIAPSGEWIEE